MAEELEQVWRIWPETGHSYDIRAAKINDAGSIICLMNERGQPIAIISKDKIKAVFLVDHLSEEPK